MIVNRRLLHVCLRISLGGMIASLALGLCGLSTGCQGGPDPRSGRIPPPSRLPTRYLAAHDVALDPQLQAAARRELATALHSGDAEVRTHAIEAVRETAGSEHAGDIVTALSDPEPLVRYAACLAAGELKITAAHELLLRRADDQDAAVRVAARFALHRLGDYRYSHELERLARDPEPRVRGTTAMILGMLGDRSALKILQTMRKDTYPAVRQEAAGAMWRLGSRQGLNDLIGWTLSRYLDDQMVALLALAQPHDRAVIQHVRNGLVAEGAQVNLVAARAMGMLGCDEGYGVAEQGARSKDPRDRLLAALAFGAIGRSDAQDLLRGLLADADPNVRIAAAEAILQLKPTFFSECSRQSA